MTYEESVSLIKEIAERCTTEEDYLRELAKMDDDTKMRLIYTKATENFYDGIDDAVCKMVDYLVDNGHARAGDMMTPLGFMRALSVVSEHAISTQSRLELQYQNAESQYGVKLINAAHDKVVQIKNLITDLIDIEAHYNGVLVGRQAGAYVQNANGDYVDYTEEELDRADALREATHKTMAEGLEEFDAWLEAHRKEKEDQGDK